MKKILFPIALLSLFFFLWSCKKKPNDGEVKNTKTVKSESPVKNDLKNSVSVKNPDETKKKTENPKVLSTRLTCVESAVFKIKTAHSIIKTHDIKVAKSIRWNEGFL